MEKRQTKGTQNVNLPSEPSLIFGFKHNLSRDFKESFTQSARETTKLSQKKRESSHLRFLYLSVFHVQTFCGERTGTQILCRLKRYLTTSLLNDPFIFFFLFFYKQFYHRDLDIFLLFYKTWKQTFQQFISFPQKTTSLP